MSDSLSCPTCDREICVGHRSHRGLLINAIASLSAGLLLSRESLASLKKKRWSKMHDAQHKKDVALMRSLEENIARDETILADFKRINEEHYGR